MMNQKYKIIWTITAENDLKGIIDYIALNNPENALNILRKIRGKVSDLYRMPEKCRIIPELSDHGITLYRELIVTPWRIMFRIADKTVFILSVLDARRNIEDILLKRLVGLQ